MRAILPIFHQSQAANMTAKIISLILVLKRKRYVALVKWPLKPSIFTSKMFVKPNLYFCTIYVWHWNVHGLAAWECFKAQSINFYNVIYCQYALYSLYVFIKWNLHCIRFELAFCRCGISFGQACMFVQSSTIKKWNQFD